MTVLKQSGKPSQTDMNVTSDRAAEPSIFFRTVSSFNILKTLIDMFSACWVILVFL